MITEELKWEQAVTRPRIVKSFLATTVIHIQTLSGLLVVKPGEYIIEERGHMRKVSQAEFDLIYKIIEPNSDVIAVEVKPSIIYKKSELGKEK